MAFSWDSWLLVSGLVILFDISFKNEKYLTTTLVRNISKLQLNYWFVVFAQGQMRKGAFMHLTMYANLLALFGSAVSVTEGMVFPEVPLGVAPGAPSPVPGVTSSLWLMLPKVATFWELVDICFCCWRTHGSGGVEALVCCSVLGLLARKNNVLGSHF